MEEKYIKNLNQPSTIVVITKLIEHYCKLQKEECHNPCVYCPFAHGICQTIEKECERVENIGADC